MDDQFFKSNFNTKLSPADEVKFNQWVSSQSKKIGRDLSMDLTDYDLRGFWNSNRNADLQGAHLTDLYKKPNHPTFSDESIYHKSQDESGNKYYGGKWFGTEITGMYYTPSVSMLSKTHDLDRMIDYFKKYEPGVKLILPAPFKDLLD